MTFKGVSEPKAFYDSKIQIVEEILYFSVRNIENSICLFQM